MQQRWVVDTFHGVSNDTADPSAITEARARWETASRELREVTDRVSLPPDDRRRLLTALDRSHAALAAWLVTAHRSET